ncbi:MAG: flagellar assembly protein FliH [Proteobacteria bacterium]|nr:flagellar assembly protein FliH [Cystobacterineae bacterium]MCL2258758.1 flagellar assembly protein FliH [Cystobacterineae bacterium]MCL2314377.1 flagellar assembly protein FliH [Pseudomonadota bacterium]
MPAYRLQTLLEMRERAEEAAKQAFSEAMRVFHKQKEILETMRSDLTRRQEERKEKVLAFRQSVLSQAVLANAFEQIERFEQRLQEEEARVELEIGAQEGTVERARQRVEQRRVEMAEAAKEKKAIEKHKEQWAKQVRYERQAREELMQEEIGNTLHLQKRRGGRL